MKIADIIRTPVVSFTGVFVILWLVAWIANAIHSTHFDLNALKDLYIWIATQLNVYHGINSGLNTDIPWLKGADKDAR